MIYLQGDRDRSSHWRCSLKKGVLKNFCKIYRKKKLPEPKVAGLRSAPLIKKRHLHRCFPVTFCEIFKSSFLRNSFVKVQLPQNYCKITAKLQQNYRERVSAK